MKYLLVSRKFWAAVIGLVIMILQSFWPDLPIDADTLANIVYLLVAYIMGVAIEDGLTARKASS